MKTPVNSIEAVALLHASPSTSNWLKEAVTELCGRDPVDAARDADTLAWIMKMRSAEVFAQNAI